MSSYPARCLLSVERRTLPGETAADVEREIAALLEGGTDATQRTLLVREPFEIAQDDPVVAGVTAAATEALGRPPAIGGASYWADAAFIAAAGIPTVLLGPGDSAQGSSPVRTIRRYPAPTTGRGQEVWRGGAFDRFPRLRYPRRPMPQAVGQPMRRKEDPRLLSGRGKYAADFRLPGMLQAAVLRSPHAHARLGAIRAEAALALPGVVAVVTAEDLGAVGRIPTRLGHRIGSVDCLQRPLAREIVRYVGTRWPS